MDKRKFKNTSDIKEVKPDYYNMLLDKPLKGCENSNIQYIIEVNRIYGIASIKPLTIADINSIDMEKWTFKPFNQWEKEWNNGK